jgi:tetratricopeptide (TPR) repeat protein
MGLFYFATLYGFMRGATGEDRSRSRRWFCVAWLACLGGMATKEVMVTAPVVVFVFDAAILSGSLRSAWDRHRRVHLALAATWLPLAWLMAGIAQRGVGFSHGISAFDYASMECKVVVRYLLLTVWPHPLVLDHGVFQAGVGTTWPYALSIAAALAGLVVAWAWWPPLGFAAFWFFAILAPTSSVIPVAIQPMAENRLYLPLAAVAVGVVLLAFFAVRRWALIGAALIAAVLGVLAAIRNGDYASERSIWEDTVKKNPSNARAHNNLGFILSREGETAPAIAEFETALRLSPDDPRTHDNLGNAWVGLPGRLDDAIHEFQLALRADPDFAEAHNNLGNAWLKSPGHLPEAISEYEAALRLKPNDVEVSSNLAQARNNLGNALLETPGHTAEAIAQYEEALRLKPDYAVGHANLARALASQSGRLSEAVEQFKAALRLDPGDALVHDDLGNTLSRIQGRTEEAIAEYQTALRLQPRLAEAHNNLGSVLLALPGRRAEAVDEFRAALEIRPDFAEAHNNLDWSRRDSTSRLR